MEFRMEKEQHVELTQVGGTSDYWMQNKHATLELIWLPVLGKVDKSECCTFGQYTSNMWATILPNLIEKTSIEDNVS